MRGFGRCPKLLLGFAASILIVNPLLACNVSAYDPSQNCSSAELLVEDPMESSVFTVSVECNQPIFFSSSVPEALSRVSLNGEFPDAVQITGSKLNLSFNYLNFSLNSLKNRSLIIEQNAIKDLDGVSNTLITLDTSQIIDKVSPTANNDGYEISGSSLSVSAIKGVLSNDFEYESAIADIIIETLPAIGDVAINNDGSFIYTYSKIGYGDDSFKYYSVDSSGNQSNVATVNIVDVEPEISAKFYNSNSPLSKYAKLGDKLVLDFKVSETSTIDEIKICGHVIYDYVNNNRTSFSASYTTTDADIEGLCAPSIKLHDIAGKYASYQGADTAGITFDKTEPVIVLDRDYVVDVNLHESIDYISEASVYDANLDEEAGSSGLVISGYVNFDVVGDYEVIYQASDLAGNNTSVKQLFRVNDEVNDRYSEYSNRLLLSGISSNLWQVSADNYENFSNLYFEKVVEGKKVGRVTFLGPIDISNYEDMFLNFVSELSKIFLADNFGKVGMDLSKIEDSSRLMDGGVELVFYNLNEIGYSNGSKQQDIISNLFVYDDDGGLISGNSILSYGSFSGCNPGLVDCYTFSLRVNHFSTYVIEKDLIAPKVSIDKIKNYEIGERIIISGAIDDIDAYLVVNIDGRDYIVPRINIKNNQWFFEINSDALGVGRHNVSVVALDFGNNKSALATEVFIIKKLSPRSEPVIANILVQPASILGDKIKGDTKSTAVVLKTNPELKLDSQELWLIIIVALLGVSILAVDRRRK